MAAEHAAIKALRPSSALAPIHFGCGKKALADHCDFVQFGRNTNVSADQIIYVIEIVRVGDAGGAFGAFFGRLENELDCAL